MLFWKMVFWLYITIYSLLYGFNYIPLSETTMPWYISLCGYFHYIMVVVACGYLYSLGWKKQLFSKKANLTITIMFFISVILSFVQHVYLNLPIYTSGYYTHYAITNGIPADLVRPSFIFDLILSYFVSLIIYWLFPLIAYIIYCKNFSEYIAFEKTYLKLFLSYLIWSYCLIPVIILLNYKYFSIITTFDYVFLLFIPVLPLLCGFGYVFSKKILKQIVWKILTPILLIFNFGTIFFVSDELRRLLHSLHCIPCGIFTVILDLILFFLIIRYAYTKDVYND